MALSRMFLVAAVLLLAVRASAQDFNNDSFIDMVIGVPGEDVNGNVDAGAVDVIYGGGHGARPPQHWTMDSSGVPYASAAGDQFGFALAWGKFNQDQYDDLAIGMPGRNAAHATRAGAVLIIHGGPNGLVANAITPGFKKAPRFIVQGLDGVPGVAKYGDDFGYSLAAGFWDDGFDFHYLAIGAPGVTAGTLGDQGRGEVVVVYPTEPGEHDQLFTQTNGDPEPGDWYGFSLATGYFGRGGGPNADLAIGIPGEDTDGATNAGAVEVLYFADHPALGDLLSSAGAQLLRQTDFEPVTQANSYFGFSLSGGQLNGADLTTPYDGPPHDLAIGEPLHDLPGAANAGVVRIIYGSDGGLNTSAVQTWTQGGLLPGVPEANDYFGYSVKVGPYPASHLNYLAVGSPGEDARIGDVTVIDAGSVHTVFAGSGGLHPAGSQQLFAITPQVRVGWSLQVQPGRLFAGAPASAGWAGGVVAFNETLPGPFTYGWAYTQTSLNVGDPSEADDRFGGSLGAGAGPLWWW